MSSRSTTVSCFRHTYCCRKRDPQPLCSRLKEIAWEACVAEYSFTGMATSPKEMVSDPIERAAMTAPSRCKASLKFDRYYRKPAQDSVSPRAHHAIGPRSFPI